MEYSAERRRVRMVERVEGMGDGEGSRGKANLLWR